jgi:undecaprenyl-diphosphatase
MRFLSAVAFSDAQMSVRLSRWSGPRWFRRLMLTMTRLGDGWLWLLGALLLAQAEKPGDALRMLVVAAGAANVVLIVMKRCCQRQRPAEMGVSIGAPRFAPELLAFDRFSFPSGHALNAFAAAGAVGLHLPAGAPVLVLIASMVAASRVFLGRHFLGDVLAGAALGSAIALGAFVGLR